jgi:hypothetical protein
MWPSSEATDSKMENIHETRMFPKEDIFLCRNPFPIRYINVDILIVTMGFELLLNGHNPNEMYKSMRMVYHYN